mgnify:CR=1 FL=1
MDNTSNDEVIASYNTEGQRILKELKGGAWQFYVTDGQQALAVIDNEGFSHFNLTGNGVFGRWEPGGARRYYITDHLGSTRAVVDDGGTVLETFDYYPFGLLMPKRNTAGANTIEKFTGKERDEEGGLNLDYFGARFYNPALGKWLGVDPLADQYPSLSPYNYAANNPLFFVDPNGKEIWIHYQDEEGEEQRLRYEVGGEYKGDNEFVQNTVSLLNEIGSIEIGAEVLGELVSSENKFNFLNQSPSTPSEKGHLGGFSFSPNEDGGGNILAGDISKIGHGSTVNSLAHEGFHAYQSEFGIRKASVNAEVGAYLFGSGVSLSLGYPTVGGGLATNSRAARAYSNAYNRLLGGDQFDQSAYRIAITNFKQGSAANSLGLYNNVPVLPINPNPPISRLYPLIR